MDSKVVNKLIHSEVWPLLRRLGFSKFNSRTAWRYRGPLVDVVNFQSFNTHLADGLGCTTFSFALNLGVYLRGSTFERRVKIGPDGNPQPQEYELSFRSHLKKRTSVDGFAREDIFYVAPDGRTMGAVMDEVLFLLEKEAPSWFAAFSDLGGVVTALSDTGANLKGAENLGLGASGAPSSHNAADLLASLQLVRHIERPVDVPAATCLEAIDRTVGAKLDIFASGYTTPVNIEWDSRRIRDLLVRIRASLELPENISRSHPAQCELFGSHWDFDGSPTEGTVESKPVPSARDSLWPELRNRGLIEFTDRLAHRPNSDSIEVVAFVPLDPAERRANSYPEGFFRVAVGVFWAKLAERDGTRMNNRGQFRPRLQDCFMEMWLMPAGRVAAAGPTCFDSVSQAASALSNDAEAWFSIWRDLSRRKCLLEQPDWAILTYHPTMRGHGSASSVPRSLISAMFGEQSPASLYAAFDEARKAVDRYPDHLKSRYQTWVERPRRAGTCDRPSRSGEQLTNVVIYDNIKLSMAETRKTRPVSWIKAALKDFEDFPEGAKSTVLGALTIAAEGGKADIAKPLHGFGSGVLEITLAYRGDAFRVVYAVQLADQIWVIHAFQKKSKQGIKTPKHEIDLVKDRLKRLKEALK